MSALCFCLRWSNMHGLQEKDVQIFQNIIFSFIIKVHPQICSPKAKKNALKEDHRDLLGFSDAQ